MTEFKTKRRLTRPILKFAEGVTHHVKIVSAMFIGKAMKARVGEEKAKEPATLMNVINLETGEECQMIANAVVKSVLTEEYPNDGYVQKCFAIMKLARQAGKQYISFDVAEIEDPTETAGTAPTAAMGRAAGGSKR